MRWIWYPDWNVSLCTSSPAKPRYREGEHGLSKLCAHPTAALLPMLEEHPAVQLRAAAAEHRTTHTRSVSCYNLSEANINAGRLVIGI